MHRSALWTLALLVGCGGGRLTDDDASDDDSATVGPDDDDTGDDDPGDDDTDDPGDDDTGDDDTGDDDTGDDDPGDDDTGDDDTGDDDTGDDPPDPSAAGPHTASTSTATLDSAGVSVPLTLSLPAGGPWPVVVLVHGFQLGPADYASWATRLATWGYAVVQPQLPGGLLTAPTHDAQRDHLEALLDWIDAAAAGGALSGRADPGSLALVGHSMGGKLALYLAATDARPDAVVGIDPVDAGGGPLNPPGTAGYPSIVPERMADVSAPLLLLGETVNGQGSLLAPACAPADENFLRAFEAATSPALAVELVGANHMAFLDNPSCLACLACPAGSADPAAVRATSTALTVAFLEQRLRGATWAADWLTGPEIAALEAAGVVIAQATPDF